MKKIIMVCVASGMLNAVLFGASAKEMMDKASVNIGKISSIDAQVDLNSKDSDNVKKTDKENITSKRILLKKPGKMKIMHLTQAMVPADNGKNEAKSTVQKAAPSDIISDDTKPVSLSPACIFDMNKFFENFDLSIKQKDERIKRGREEIVAIRKGQTAQYPQIRIIIMDGLVEEMKFYSISGKRYYEVKVNTYEKSKGIDIPVDITEKITSQNNIIVNNIKYSNIEVNTAIPDSEFIKQP